MRHEVIDLDHPRSGQADLSALRRAITATLFRAIAVVMVLVWAATLAAAYVAVSPQGHPPTDRVLAVIVSSAAVALFGICVLSLILARGIARFAVEPISLLLPHLDHSAGSQYRWEAGRAMSRKDLTHDLSALERDARQANARTRQMIGDLDRARELANEQNLAKSRFLANMSHELRTPLNAILGYTMLLHEDAADKKDASAMADLDRIEQAGRNLLGVINGILDLAGPETGKNTIERDVVDLAMLLRSAIMGYQAPAARNGNTLTCDIAPDTPTMVGDQSKIVQCLRHLVGNAMRFTQDGKVEIAVSGFEHAGARWVQFEVRDTGIGIDPAQQEELFDAFHPIDGGGQRQHGGMGSGLSTVRQLAKLMGGNCTVESALGHGSTFRLKLPSGEVEDNADTAPSEAPGDATGSFSETPSAEHTALIVDDDETAIDLLRRWLTRMGYNVLSTTDGATGMRLARTHKPHVILLDAVLPELSGYEIAERLRSDSETADIPTIIITVDDDRERGLRSGASDYLRKPVSETQLREVLDVYRGRVAGDVLVIDDDDDAADLVARCVAQVGFSSRRAADGHEGLAMMSEKRPDAIVLDLAMPSMNGFEVLDRLAADPALARIPLIVVSGADITAEERARLVDAGLSYMPKAASTPREIAQTLKTLVT